MWQAIPECYHVLREVTDFGLGKLATVSAQVSPNRWLVLSEQISHTDHTAIDWTRMTAELFAGDLAKVVEAQ